MIFVFKCDKCKKIFETDIRNIHNTKCDSANCDGIYKRVYTVPTIKVSKYQE